MLFVSSFPTRTDVIYHSQGNVSNNNVKIPTLWTKKFHPSLNDNPGLLSMVFFFLHNGAFCPFYHCFFFTSFHIVCWKCKMFIINFYCRNIVKITNLNIVFCSVFFCCCCCYLLCMTFVPITI